MPNPRPPIIPDYMDSAWRDPYAIVMGCAGVIGLVWVVLGLWLALARHDHCSMATEVAIFKERLLQ